MCLLVVASRVLADWPLVVAANRDEQYDRPAVSVRELRPPPFRTLGGRDLLAGGTWLAVNQEGVVAGLTNRPQADGRDSAKRSRGEIPLALTAAADAATAVAGFGATYQPGRYNPCWVLVGDRTDLFLVDLTDRLEVTPLGPGVHVLENKPLEEPSSKVDRVKTILGPGPWTPEQLEEGLAAVLGDHTITDPGGGRPEVSACCVHGQGYGTRSAMLVFDPADPTEAPRVRASVGPSCTNPVRMQPWT